MKGRCAGTTTYPSYDYYCNEEIKRLDLEEEAVARVILSKLSGYPGLSYVEIAKTAYRIGKTRLATMVL